MKITLKDKKALICGSTQGIGKAAAIEIAELGARITLFARNEAALKEVCELLPEKGGPHSYLVADFSHPEQVKEALDEFIAKEHGVHIVVNNTGGPPAGKAIEADPEEYLVAFNQQLVTSQIVARAMTPFMTRENYGRIVNVISTSVKIPIQGLGVSNTIRGAVANWSKTLSNELGQYGITVNNVLPGSTRTKRLESIFEVRSQKLGIPIEEVRENEKDKIPLSRFAEPEEIAYAIAFLVSPAAAYINGVNLPVDGGRTGSL